MWRCSWPSRCFVQFHSLASTTEKLNDMLDLRRRAKPMQPEALKQYLNNAVIPVLRSTKLDRRHDSSVVRRSMAQLLRDATFAAVVLRASPTGAYMSAIVDCIKHDHERMQFISNMTSNQASRMIENICRVGVEDSAVQAPLVARLDFSNLKEVARAMFALGERGMYHVVVYFIVPMYCGECWQLEYDEGRMKDGIENNSCNVFEAVRVLRILSKAVRGVVEQQRVDRERGAITPLPTESIQRLRTSLIAFIVKHREVLRGGHWINFTRAMALFPQEFGVVKYAEDCAIVMREIEALQLPNRHAQLSISKVVFTQDLVALGMTRLFAPFERQQKEESGHLRAEKTRGSILDVPLTGMAKIIPVIEDVPFPKITQQRWLAVVIDVILRNVEKMNCTQLIQVLHTMRRIENSAQFDACLKRVVEAISARLIKAAELASTGSAAEPIPYASLVQFAVLLSAFRVKSCEGFVRYLLVVAPKLRLATVEDTASLMEALATVGPKDGLDLCRRAGEETLQRVRGETGTRSVSLLSESPLSCVKILRACVLLNAAPSLSFITTIFATHVLDEGSRSPLTVGDGSVLFDAARSLYHFSRMKPLNTEWSQTLWSRGVVQTLLPLLQRLTSQWRDELSQNAANKQRLTGIPNAWRSAMETVLSFVDINLDAISLAAMQQRVSEIYPQCRDIMVNALRIVEEQLCCTSGANSEPPSFSSKSSLHFFSFLLMLEHLIYHGTWQAEVRGDADSAQEVQVKMQLIKEDYNVLVTGGAQVTGPQSDSCVLSVMGRLLPPEDGNLSGRTSPLHLSRGEILDITRNLPFAVSLVVSQGPVNQLFCERAAAIMLHTSE
ncbi:hypothetical protein TRVL_06219 [Trypanosoma vivax]|nr:hypothetical protein TRVL_06219 [Trypanosoma vivax]